MPGLQKHAMHLIKHRANELSAEIRGCSNYNVVVLSVLQKTRLGRHANFKKIEPKNRSQHKFLKSKPKRLVAICKQMCSRNAVFFFRRSSSTTFMSPSSGLTLFKGAAANTNPCLKTSNSTERVLEKHTKTTFAH